MVEWMGRNFDVFPGFQKIPCYYVIQCTCGISCPLLKSNSFMDNSYMHIRKKQIFLMKTEFFNENRFFQIDFLTLHELFERVVSCWIS